MNDNIVFILSNQLKEIREDVKIIRDVLSPMNVDLQYHIKRTDLNEARIEELETQLVEEEEKRNKLLEKKLRLIKIGLGLVTMAVALGSAIGQKFL